MTEVANRQYKQTLPISPPSSKSYNLHQLIAMDPILADYFKRQSSFEFYWALAHDLILDGIRYRAIKSNSKVCCCQQQIINNQVRNKENIGVSNNKQFKQVKKNIRNFSNQEKDRKSPSNQKNKHYNVSYIKHNRFLSPSQKRQLITPKVTQVIPVKSTPLVIYGKPRVKIDDQYGCPYHENEQQCWQSIPYGEPCRQKTQRTNQIREIHIKQKNITKNIINQQNKYKETEGLSKYKSTPNLKSEDIQLYNMHETKKNLILKDNKPDKKKIKLNKKTEEQEGQTIYVNRIIEVQSRVPGKVRIVQTPKSRLTLEDSSHNEDYDSYLQAKFTNKKNQKYQSNHSNQNKKEIESKIKFLIQQDKNNKALQKNMKKQQDRIKKLQNYMSKNKKFQKPEKNTVKITADDILSLSQSSSSGMSLMNSQLVNKYKKNQNKASKDNEKRKINDSGFFGTKNEELNQQQEDDCQCSKTLNEDESQLNSSEQIQNQSDFSNFNT